MKEDAEAVSNVDANADSVIKNNDEASDDNEVAIDSDGSYEVVKGDCLWNIAKAAYGDGTKWVEIYNANADLINNPDLIYIGQTFVIPNLTSAA